LHQLTGAVCIALLACLVTSEVLIVMLRYIYGIGFLQLQDFAAYSFAALMILGIPYALARDAHVRVDVFRDGQSQAQKNKIDIAAILLLLMPVFGMTLYSVMPDITYSWQIKEGSKETGGLPGLFVVKSVLPLVCVLMIIQGLVIVARLRDTLIKATSI
jgi:TRAP-type mannitol/chloroaromatic compound transport system permease small subunit